jgi:hypothetical protein
MHPYEERSPVPGALLLYFGWRSGDQLTPLSHPSLDRSEGVGRRSTGPGGHAHRTCQSDAEPPDRQILAETKLFGRVTFSGALVMQAGSLRRYPPRHP